MRKGFLDGRARRPGVFRIGCARIAILSQIQFHDAALSRRIHRFFAIADFDQRAVCYMIMLPRRKRNRRHAAILEAVHHNMIRKQKIDRPLCVFRLKRTFVNDSAFRKRRIADSRSITGNQHARQIQSVRKITRVFKHAAGTDTHMNSRRIRPANCINIPLRHSLMVAEQQCSMHIKCNQTHVFHRFSSSVIKTDISP